MSEPVLIQRTEILALAQVLRLRLKELHAAAASARTVSKIGLITHLEEDVKQLDRLVALLRSFVAEGKA